ncbi:uncharacterized protein MONOS_10241 [Monocercomonoides exilis]|uniref:uncharacterized protein n=1 Tax=Monocercomonoides exilis TaxID=2049356 RepID=UPI003559AD9F|nr:hypothetical protein MONOS_10241 [Monocercomonoides exilis]|eukprot:MONOS_10241.1-p1 / transcript=MONOS_10241.1 / gene=MONOS_10241 / organism=Monocercomonoides_exilis_PA203 / gene_product=unspecified product / transcript_product=unspecified product / location=Mono_scaffold00457:40343-41878(+) / protein_length=512 / sequence_SO=supercontig / SO=protein_coding / is_pseudo=false
MRLHTTAQNHFCQDSIGKVGGAARAMLIQSERESMLERWMVEDKKWKRSHETSEMHSYSNCFTDTTKVNKIQQTAFLDGPMQKKRREIIRKQIKEAKQFERVFGEWVRKEWVSNEEERKMWDAAEFKERFEVPGDIDAGTDECTDEDCSKDAHPSVRRALTLEEMKTKLKTSDLNAMTETEKDDYLNQIARESMKEKKACTVASFLVLPHSSRQSRKRDEKAQIQALSLKSEQRQLDLSTVIAPQGSCNETSTPMHHIELREAAKTDTLQNISQKLLHFPSMFESNRNSTDYSSQLHSKLYSPVSLSEPFCIKKQRLREIPKAGNDKNLGRFEPRLHKESNSSATEKRISSSQHSLHTSFPQLHMNSLLHNTFEKEPYFCDSACTTFSQLYFIQEEESALPSFPSWVLSQPSAGVGIVFDVNKTVADAEEFLPRHSEVLNNGKTAKKMRRKGMDPNAFLQKTRDLMAEVLIRPNLVVPFCKITKTKEKKKAKGKIHNLYSLNLSCLQGRLM